jgi:hypothetical protein
MAEKIAADGSWQFPKNEVACIKELEGTSLEGEA